MTDWLAAVLAAGLQSDRERVLHSIFVSHLPDLRHLCERYNVARLEVFGSAARDDFDPETSDVDLLVTFGPADERGEFRQYIDFVLDCESLLGRKVDLVEEECISNRFFRDAVSRSRTLIYAS